MASITPDGHRRWRIQFIGADRKRKTIRLVEVSKRFATLFHIRLEDLVGGAPEDQTRQWVATLPPAYARKLAKAGLIREPEAHKPAAKLALKSFLDDYTAKRTDVKPATQLVFGHTKRCLNEYFGEAKAIEEISEGEADLWKLWLREQGLSSNTIRRRCGIAKQFFRAALRRKLIQANPFEGFKSNVQANDSRDFFVSREMAAKVLAACPTHEWRLLFALSRYGGLRCPSEHFKLKWADVDWDKGRFRVYSPKTEHHAGGDSRMVPIFPELLPYLREAFERAEPGAEMVLTLRDNNVANMRTGLCKIIVKAGLTPWPKLFQNMRSTRETELAEDYPLHLVCAWIGNSKVIATKHYLQVTDDHFAQASNRVTPSLASHLASHQAPSQAVKGESKPSENPPEPAFSGQYPPMTAYADASPGQSGHGRTRIGPENPGDSANPANGVSPGVSLGDKPGLERVTGAGKRAQAAGRRQPELERSIDAIRNLAQGDGAKRRGG